MPHTTAQLTLAPLQIKVKQSLSDTLTGERAACPVPRALGPNPCSAVGDENWVFLAGLLGE